jgi:hypothetical protein
VKVDINKLTQYSDSQYDDRLRKHPADSNQVFYHEMAD